MRNPMHHYGESEKLRTNPCNVRCRPEEHVHAEVLYGEMDVWELSGFHGHEPGVAVLLETEPAVEAPEPESGICRGLPAWLVTFQYLGHRAFKPGMKLDHLRSPRAR